MLSGPCILNYKCIVNNVMHNFIELKCVNLKCFGFTLSSKRVRMTQYYSIKLFITLVAIICKISRTLSQFSSYISPKNYNLFHIPVVMRQNTSYIPNEILFQTLFTYWPYCLFDVFPFSIYKNNCIYVIYIYINAILLTPGGSSTVHIYSKTVH
jgi:hypothetical protein